MVVNSKPISDKIFLRATEDDPKIICNATIKCEQIRIPESH